MHVTIFRDPEVHTKSGRTVKWPVWKARAYRRGRLQIVAVADDLDDLKKTFPDHEVLK